MGNDDKVIPQALAPVVVTVIGTGTGDGGAPIQDGQMLKTPDHQPNLIVQVVTPAMAILVRFVNTFLTQLVGLLVAAMTPVGGKLLYTGDFIEALVLCSSLALPGAALGLIKDCITVFARLEQKFPLMTGSV